MRDWRKYLRQDDEAYQAFTEYLAQRQADATREMEDASSWEAVLEARGKKKVLAILIESLTMDAKEEAAHGRAFGHARHTRDT